jgi:hypothetical protein
MGYLLMVDISTPEEKMKDLDCLPLAPAKRLLSFSDLSTAQQSSETIETDTGFVRRSQNNEHLSLDFYHKKTMLFIIKRYDTT